MKIGTNLGALIAKKSVDITVKSNAQPVIAADAKLAQLFLGILTLVFEGLCDGFKETSLSLSGAVLLAPFPLTPKSGSNNPRMLHISSSELSARNAPKHKD